MDLRKDIYSFLYCWHIGYCEAAAPVFLAYAYAPGIVAQVFQYPSESLAVIIRLVSLVNKVNIHRLLLQYHLLYTQAPGQAAQTWNPQQFGCDVGNFSEAVDQSVAEGLQVRLIRVLSSRVRGKARFARLPAEHIPAVAAVPYRSLWCSRPRIPVLHRARRLPPLCPLS